MCAQQLGATRVRSLQATWEKEVKILKKFLCEKAEEASCVNLTEKLFFFDANGNSLKDKSRARSAQDSSVTEGEKKEPETEGDMEFCRFDTESLLVLG